MFAKISYGSYDVPLMIDPFPYVLQYTCVAKQKSRLFFDFITE